MVWGGGVGGGGFFFFQAEDGIRDHCVTGVQTCALPISNQIFMPLIMTQVHIGKIICTAVGTIILRYEVLSLPYGPLLKKILDVCKVLYHKNQKECLSLLTA